MEKTIRLLVLLTIITGLFFTACTGPDVVSPDDEESDVEDVVEIMDADVEEEDDEEDDDEEDSDEEVEIKGIEVVADPVVEEVVESVVPVVEEPSSAPGADPGPVVAPPEPDPAPVVEEPVVADPEPATVYLDGNYSQVGSYNSPAGPETVSVNLSVAGDVVTGVTVTPNATHDTSKKFQGLFAQAISGQVVGKKLDEIGAFSAVNGSSLTPGAFNSALAGIKAKAKN